MTLRPLALVALAALAGCASEPEGLRLADPGTGAQIRFDLSAKPLPDIPLPNDFATRADPTSPSGRRLNASLLATDEWERSVRGALDALDGWGTFAPISVSFTAPIDPEVIYARHRDDYDFSNDAVYLVDVTPDSPELCKPIPLDFGEGNFPSTLERQQYFPDDPREDTNTLLFEEAEEDTNGNGVLDPGEDTDMDGVLDHPNTRHPDPKLPADLMTFYERETNTLVARPLMPMRENSTYAVVLTRRLLDQSGRPIRSPFRYINDTSQTAALQPLKQCLPGLRLTLDDVAFTWSFTTQSITRDFRAIRDGLYGTGPMKWLADKYPAVITDIPNARNGEPLPGVNLKIVKTEQFLKLAKMLMPLAAGQAPQATVDALIDSHKFIDYHVVGQFESPQFFRRVDEAGNPMPIHHQLWEVNPLTGAAFDRPETITFWLTIPKKDYGKRPVPVVMLGHGYGGSKLELVLAFGGFFARQGMATFGMEAVSHGLPLNDDLVPLLTAIADSANLGPMFQTLAKGRAFDQNHDGYPDSGADFFTAHLFHSRDMIRQSVVDFMRGAQLLSSFDGKRHWQFDLDNNGATELAGDFDGDGQIDVGGGAPLHFCGASLGGILGTVTAGIEPKISSLVEMSGGGGLMDIGVRTTLSPVVSAVYLRLASPLFVTRPADGGGSDLWMYVPDLNKTAELKIARIPVPLLENDTAVLTNLGQPGAEKNTIRCARVQKDEKLRVAVPADEGDVLSLAVYDGVLPTSPGDGCSVPDDRSPKAVISALGYDVAYQPSPCGEGDTCAAGFTCVDHKCAYPAGTGLFAFTEGFGLRRATPEMRRFLSISQIALDPADPANYAPFWERRLLRHSTGEEVRTRALAIVTDGDMVVPASTGAVIGRAAGFIDFQRRDPRYNKTPNQVLIDDGVLEATERIPRFINSEGHSVLMDVDYLSQGGAGHDGYNVPRLDPPLRLVKQSAKAGGYSGIIFAMVDETGRHVIDVPDPSKPFDTSMMVLNIAARYLATNGTDYTLDPCNASNTCPWLPPVPDVQTP